MRPSDGVSAEGATGPTAVVAVGMGCWIATLLLYSETLTPFQRAEGLASFVGTFAPLSLALAALLSLAAALAALRGRFLPARVLGPVACVLHLAGCALFAVLSLVGVPAGAGGAALTALLSALVAAGGTGSALAWGRVCRAYDVRRSLAVVAGAGVVATLASLLVWVLPLPATAAAFALLAAVAGILPATLGPSEGDGSATPAHVPAAASGGGARERVASLAAVAAPSLAGLAAFAFIMGTMRVLIVETYAIHLGTLSADSLVLGALALLPARRPLMRAAYRTLLPAFAVTLLAVTNVTASLFGGSSLDMVLIFALYTLAALLTLATFAAIAHAGEFACDLVFAVELGTFCLASALGQLGGRFMGEEAIRVGIIAITTAYAFALALIATLRSGRADERDDLLAAPGPADGPVPDAAVGGSATGKAADELGELERRCAELAATCGLTAREAEVLAIIAQGHASGYVSEVLYISPNTARTHVHNIYRKLGVGSREQVITLAREGRASRDVLEARV